jgi:hypothetical protein
MLRICGMGTILRFWSTGLYSIAIQHYIDMMRCLTPQLVQWCCYECVHVLSSFTNCGQDLEQKEAIVSELLIKEHELSALPWGTKLMSRQVIILCGSVSDAAALFPGVCLFFSLKESPDCTDVQ